MKSNIVIQLLSDSKREMVHTILSSKSKVKRVEVVEPVYYGVINGVVDYYSQEDVLQYKCTILDDIDNIHLEDFRDRLVLESLQLRVKLEKLTKFVHSDLFVQLPKEEMSDLKQQLFYMEKYSEILSKRLQRIKK